MEPPPVSPSARSWSRALWRGAVVVCCLVVVALPEATSGCRGGLHDEVVIGALVARTGDRAVWGVDLYRGIALAVDQWNERGGVLGRPVRLQTRDDESRDELAGSLVSDLCAPDPDRARDGGVRDRPSMVVIGEVSTAANERGAQAAQRRNVPFIGAANTLRDIRNVGEFAFRTALTDNEQAAALARHVRNVMQRRRAAVIYRRSSLVNLTLADAFVQAFRAAGGDVPLRDTFEGEDTELVHLASRIRAANADVVYVPADATDAARVSVALRHGRVTAQIVGTDDWLAPDLRRYASDSVTGALLPEAFSPMVRRPEIQQFVQRFREKYHASPGSRAALGYDATRWVLSVATRVPSLEPRALRDALAGSRLDDAVGGPFQVDAHRILTRGVNLVRVEPDGFSFVGMAP